MTVASITTDINIGPYKIPSNAQNMIMNNYANRFNLSIEVVIPEPIMSNELATTQWLNKEFKFSNIILCSIYQLPEDKIKINKLLKNMQGVKFHFAIEGMSGKGSKFIRITNASHLIKACWISRLLLNVPSPVSILSPPLLII